MPGLLCIMLQLSWYLTEMSLFQTVFFFQSLCESKENRGELTI